MYWFICHNTTLWDDQYKRQELVMDALTRTAAGLTEESSLSLSLQCISNTLYTLLNSSYVLTVYNRLRQITNPLSWCVCIVASLRENVTVPILEHQIPIHLQVCRLYQSAYLCWWWTRDWVDWLMQSFLIWMVMSLQSRVQTDDHPALNKSWMQADNEDSWYLAFVVSLSGCKSALVTEIMDIIRPTWEYCDYLWYWYWVLNHLCSTSRASFHSNDPTTFTWFAGHDRINPPWIPHPESKILMRK